MDRDGKEKDNVYERLPFVYPKYKTQWAAMCDEIGEMRRNLPAWQFIGNILFSAEIMMIKNLPGVTVWPHELIGF